MEAPWEPACQRNNVRGVIPAKAGIQWQTETVHWTPAFAGVTMIMPVPVPVAVAMKMKMKMKMKIKDDDNDHHQRP
ncbi:hypothetical protein ECTPHS_04833 [Ectothiorhodospira sp. PHS-1]|nr:hypothetical protein ECTPHS_04833 [Ectothiorhodospira sp. PHS-1]